MDLTALIKHLRLSVLDDTGGTGVSWEDIDEDSDGNVQLRWSNEELTSFINEAFRQAHRRSLLIKTIEPTFNISVTAGTATYSIDPRIIRIKGASLSSTGKELEKLEYEDLLETTNWSSKIDTPTHYIIDYGTNSITLYPNPIVNDTVTLLVYREEMTQLSWENPEGSPEIDARYQLSALNYAAFMAYNKDEANTFDPQRANYFLSLFTAQFGGDTSAYSERRRVRSRGRGIRYGGL